jgi:hypothetical protein
VYAISDPRTSNREAAKHCIMLEEHLQIPAKRCPDCIQKHFLAVEGYVEEAITLDGAGQFTNPHLARSVKMLEGSWRKGVNPVEVAQQVRRLRKRLTHGGLAGDPPPHLHKQAGTPFGAVWLVVLGVAGWAWWKCRP